MKHQILVSLIFLISVGFLQAQEKYNRKDYPHWQKQTCSARELTLFRNVTGLNYVGKPCDIESGVWTLKLSNDIETDPSKIDIDHVIPLKYAHEHGASEWTREQRRTFANDQENLIVTSQRQNRSKGAKGPSEYMPPANACWYANQWVYLQKKYDLQLANVDNLTITQTLQGCVDNMLRRMERMRGRRGFLLPGDI